MSNFVLSQEEATRAAKRLKKNLFGEFQLDIPLNKAQHLLAKSLGAANWNALDFQKVTTAQVDAAETRVRMEFFLKVHTFVWIDNNAVETGRVFLGDARDGILKLDADSIRSLRDCTTQSEDLISHEDVLHFTGDSEDFGFTVQGIEQSFIDHLGKSNSDLTDFEIKVFKAYLESSVDSLWVPARYRSVWDGGSVVETDCIVNLITGVVDAIETVDGVSGDVLDFEAINYLGFDFLVTDDDGFYRVENLGEFIYDSMVANHRLNGFIDEFVDMIVMRIQDACEDDFTCERLDDLTYNLTGGKRATHVNNNGISSQVRFALEELGLRGSLKALTDILNLDNDFFAETLK